MRIRLSQKNPMVVYISRGRYENDNWLRYRVITHWPCYLHRAVTTWYYYFRRTVILLIVWLLNATLHLATAFVLWTAFVQWTRRYPLQVAVTPFYYFLLCAVIFLHIKHITSWTCMTMLFNFATQFTLLRGFDAVLHVGTVPTVYALFAKTKAIYLSH